MGKPIISGVVADHARSEAAASRLWPATLEERYFKAVFDSQFGFGRLQPLFEIQNAENISVHGYNSVKVYYADGTVEKWPPVADSDEELLEQLRQMGSNARPRRTLDAHNLDMTLMIGHRFRVHAVSNEISVRPRIAIRQHLLTPDLPRRSRSPRPDAGASGPVPGRRRPSQPHDRDRRRGRLRKDHLPASSDRCHPGRRAVRHHGDRPGAVLAPDAGPQQRSSAVRPGPGWGSGAPTVRGSARLACPVSSTWGLRQFLLRLIVGEIRGSEASALFQAMSIGTGTMFTVHSRDPQTTPIRLASRVAEGGVYTVDEAMRQIGLMVDLIIYIEVIDDRHLGGHPPTSDQPDRVLQPRRTRPAGDLAAVHHRHRRQPRKRSTRRRRCWPSCAATPATASLDTRAER